MKAKRLTGLLSNSFSLALFNFVEGFAVQWLTPFLGFWVTTDAKKRNVTLNLFQGLIPC